MKKRIGNVELAAKIADMLDAEEFPETFQWDYCTIFAELSCGTVGCAIGAIALHPKIGPLCKLRVDLAAMGPAMVIRVDGDPLADEFEQLAMALDASNETIMDIFDGDYAPLPRVEVRPSHVAARLREHAGISKRGAK